MEQFTILEMLCYRRATHNDFLHPINLCNKKEFSPISPNQPIFETSGLTVGQREGILHGYNYSPHTGKP
jgi:hypothetical protein